MNYLNQNFVKLSALAMWFLLAILFSLLLISRSWAAAALIPAALVGFVFLQSMPKQLLIILLAGVPTVFVYANNWLSVIPFMRVERAIIVALLGALIAGTLLNRRQAIPMITAEKAMIFILVFFGISLVVKNYGQPWPVSKESIVVYVNAFFLPYAIFFLARRVEWSGRDFDRLLVLLAAAGVYLTVCGALQYYLQYDFFYPVYEDPPVAGRASGTFHNPGEYGMVMGALLVLSMYKLARAGSQPLRLVWSSAIVLFGFAVIISSTRNAWLALVVTLGYLFFVEPKCRRLIMLLGVSVAISIAVWLLYADIGGELAKRATDVSTMYPRISAYTTAVNIISQNPVFGLGFGSSTFIDAKAEYAETFGLVGVQWTIYAGVPHNEYLHIAVLTGLTGLAVIIWLWRGIYRAIDAAPDAAGQSGWRRDFLPYCKSIVLLYLVSGLLVDTIAYRYYLFLLFFLCAVIAARPPERERAKRHMAL